MSEQLMPDGFRRLIEFSPAFDKRHANPAKNYGIHGVDMRFVLVGPLGATHFVLYTNWQTKGVRDENAHKRMDHRCLYEPMPADLGYHSPRPMYDDHAQTRSSCPYLNGAPCYGDGSGLAANDAFDALTDGGEEAVWKLLRETYDERFAVPSGAEQRGGDRG